MNVTNKNKCRPWSNRLGSAIRQRRFAVALSLAGSTMLGIALATGQVVPFGLKQTEVTKTSHARPQPDLSVELYQNTSLSTYSPPQVPIPAVSPAGDLQVSGDFVMDGLEFTLAGAEVSNGSFRELGNTVSWLVQELAQPDNAQIVASPQPNDASLVAYPVRSPTEKETATRLLQNAAWTR